MADNTGATVQPSEQHKQYDIVVYGITGFTGRLAARYIISKYGVPKKVSPGKVYHDGAVPAVSYAFAGRSEAKMKKVRDELAREFEDLDLSSIPLLVADSNDYESIRDLTAKTKVIANLVGPYIHFGEPVIKACIQTETHYCDTTGEFPWVKRMAAKYDTIAKASRVKLVSFCALGSLPSDIGAFLLHERSIEKYQKSCKEIRVRHFDAFTDLSGGTLHSLSTYKTCYPESESKNFYSEYYLCDDSADKTPSEIKPPKPYRYEPHVGYVVKSAFESVDAKVVHWAASMLPQIQKPFRFTLGIGNFKSRLSAALFYAYSSFMERLLNNRVTGAFLYKFILPAPGDGPKGVYKRKLDGKYIGLTEDHNGDTQTITGTLKLFEDPGYAGTAKMIVESALMMAHDIENCPQTFGILPPSVGLGPKIRERLAACNIFITLDD